MQNGDFDDRCYDDVADDFIIAVLNVLSRLTMMIDNDDECCDKTVTTARRNWQPITRHRGIGNQWHTVQWFWTTVPAIWPTVSFNRNCSLQKQWDNRHAGPWWQAWESDDTWHVTRDQSWKYLVAFPLFLPFPFSSLFVLYPYLVQRGALPKSHSREPGQQTVSSAFEVENHVPVIALLQKFLENQVCIVMRIGPVTYRYGISQKWSGGTVSSLRRKSRYGIPSLTVPPCSSVCDISYSDV